MKTGHYRQIGQRNTKFDDENYVPTCTHSDEYWREKHDDQLACSITWNRKQAIKLLTEQLLTEKELEDIRIEAEIAVRLYNQDIDALLASIPTIESDNYDET